jgi:hypothetical protein
MAKTKQSAGVVVLAAKSRQLDAPAALLSRQAQFPQQMQTEQAAA